MATIDSRVVEMKFNNAQFEAGVSKTLGTLDKLKGKLNFDSAKKGFGDLSAASKNFSLAGMASGIDNMSKKFSALNVIGVTALATIANKAVNAGLQLVKSFTIAPILDGFHQYEKQINATQTILANTSQSGAKLKDVTATLAVLNEYANKTIYNFSDMATNLGTFTSAGIKLGPAADAIQGLSNVAAAAGAGTQQAAGAMYQLSQALGRGKLTAQDWNSVVAAGMASSSFKGAILETAKAMGTLKIPPTQTIEQYTKAGGSFQDAMSKGQLTAGVLIQTLQVMKGSLTDAQLAQKGYTKEQIISLQAMAKTAVAAAVNVKTFTALKDNLSQGVGSAYAQVFKTLFGDLPAATTLFTKLSGILNTIFVDPINSLNVFLQGFKKLGGITNVMVGLKNIFSIFGVIFTSLKGAFAAVFPPGAPKALASLALAFRKFSENFKVGSDAADKLKRVFIGVFSIFKIGLIVVGAIVKSFFSLFGVLGGGSGGILSTLLSLAAAAGDFAAKLQTWIASSGMIQSFFNGLATARANVMLPLINFVSRLVDAFKALFSGDVSGFTSGLGVAFSSLSGIVVGFGKNIANFFGKISSYASTAAGALKQIGSSALTPIIGILDTISTTFGELKNKFNFKLDFSSATGAFNSLGGAIDKVKGSFGGMSVAGDAASATTSKLGSFGSAVANIFKGLLNAFNSVGKTLGPIVSNIGAFFKMLSDKLVEFIKGLDFQDAVALLNTGFFIALYLAVKKFVGVMSNIADKLGGLIDTITNVFDQLTNTLKTMQQNVKATIILKIAIAVGILVGAIYVLSQLDPKKLAIALGGLSAIFIQIGLAVKFITFDQKGMVAAGTGIILLAVAIRILAGAVAEIAKLNYQELIKGLIGVGLLLAGLTLFTKFAKANEGAIQQGVGLILLAIAIRLLVTSIEIIGKMDTKSLIKGVVTLGVVLFMLGEIVKKFNGVSGIPAAAFGLLILSAALLALSVVIRIYDKIDLGTMAKGLALIGATLFILTKALKDMPLGLPAIGFGLVLVAGALLILSKVLNIMGAMSIESITKSLIVLALTMHILVAAMNAAEGALPGAAAILVLVIALRILVPVLVLLGNLPFSVILKGLLAIAGIFLILGLAGKFLAPVIPVLGALSLAVAGLGLAMLLAGAGFLLFSLGFVALVGVGAAGFATLIVGFTGLLSLIPVFAQQIGLGIIAFAVVIRTAGPKIVDALTVVLISMIKAVGNTIGPLIVVGGKLITAFTLELMRRIPQIAAAGLRMIVALLQAVKSRIGQITNLAVDIIVRFLNALSKRLPQIIQSGVNLIISFIEGLARAIRNNKDRLNSAGGDLARALIEGLASGISNLGGYVRDAAVRLAGNLPGWMKKILGINSPSKVMHELGQLVSQGLANGITSFSGRVQTSAENVGLSAIDSMKSSLSNVADVLLNDLDFQPIIAPVIDLTDFRKGASQMSGLLAITPVQASVSLKQANGVATDRQTAQQSNGGNTSQGSPSIVNFEQTIQSPIALSTSEIYRQTHNQLSQAKTALGLVG